MIGLNQDDTATTRRRRTQAPSPPAHDHPCNSDITTTDVEGATKTEETRHTLIRVVHHGQGKKGHRRKKRRSKPRESIDDPSFLSLIVQVGSCLALLWLSAYMTYRHFFSSSLSRRSSVAGGDDDDQIASTVGQGRPKPLNLAPDGELARKIVFDKKEKDDESWTELANRTSPPLPTWNLTRRSTAWDAFGLAERRNQSSRGPLSVKGDHPPEKGPTSDDKLALFWQTADGLRNQFVETYGGENAARALLERSTTTFARSVSGTHDVPSDMMATACRIHEARLHQRPFRFAFGGYSVTSGRGNLFQQSFPLVMEKLLHNVFMLLSVELVVKNAAIGGCPAFPYGWCMPNFWGMEADVVSWDYSMNEAGGDPVGLEAYLRQVMQLPHAPKLLVKDTHMAETRRQLLQAYVDGNFLEDPVVIHTEPGVQPFLDRPERDRPLGFQEWRKFGAPPGAPGQALHHPAVKEHELIAWVLAMHFLSSLELLALSEHDPNLLECPPVNDDTSSRGLPNPMTTTNLTKEWKSMLFGQAQTGSDAWKMNPVHCRTSFKPLVQGDLTGLMVTGSMGEDIDIMLPKSKMYYNKGWVLDLSEGEKKAKRNLMRFGGLGFVDEKRAYYGLYASGTLRMLLPFETARNGTKTPYAGDKAVDWFKALVVCEVNEKRGTDACNTEKDVLYRIGGVNVTNAVMMDTTGTLFLGKKLCIYLPVPAMARLTTRGALRQEDLISSKLVAPRSLTDQDQQVGLSLEAKVHNIHILKREQACSISHVVWEQTT